MSLAQLGGRRLLVVGPTGTSDASVFRPEGRADLLDLGEVAARDLQPDRRADPDVCMSIRALIGSVQAFETPG